MVTSCLLNSVASLETRADGEEAEEDLEGEEGTGDGVEIMDETAEVVGEEADHLEIVDCPQHVTVEVEIMTVTETTIVVGTTVPLDLVEVVLHLLAGISRDLKATESILPLHMVLMVDRMDLPLLVDPADMDLLLPLEEVAVDMVDPLADLAHQELVSLSPLTPYHHKVPPLKVASVVPVQMVVAPQVVPLEVVQEWVHLLENLTVVVLLLPAPLPLEGTWDMDDEAPQMWVDLLHIKEMVPATIGVLPQVVVSCYVLLIVSVAY